MFEGKSWTHPRADPSMSKKKLQFATDATDWTPAGLIWLRYTMNTEDVMRNKARAVSAWLGPFTQKSLSFPEYDTRMHRCAHVFVLQGHEMTDQTDLTAKDS